MVPQAKVGVAHGQMEGDILEQRMIDFIEGDYDVLVCTSIIENGLDIPNANTIIINQAQNFGLSDLHQLRGRVGRSNVQAFCYLITPDTLMLTNDARRRLQAIESFSDLGSGFNISMQDLDIRGAGNLLGAEQSGFIADMGFETYKKILDEALDELKDEHILTEDGIPESENEDFITDCNVDTDFELYIPDEYVNVQSEKIRLYKELDSMPDEDAIKRFVSELEDRYGRMPKQVEELINVVRLRHLAQKLGFEKIVLKNGIMVAYFISNPLSAYYKGKSKVFDKVMGYIQGRGAKFIIKQQKEKLYVTSKYVDSVRKATDLLEDMLKNCNV
jgi:transcription-repair coupling factor (superfamily II helicase)